MIGAFEDRPVPLVAHIDGKLPAPSLADFGEVIDQFTRLHGRPREPLVPAGWTAPAGLGDCLDALAWALVEPLETGENRKEAVQLMMRLLAVTPAQTQEAVRGQPTVVRVIRPNPNPNPRKRRCLASRLTLSLTPTANH